MRIALVIGRLNRAGAETQLVLLARNLKKLGNEVTVISLEGEGDLDENVDQDGINLIRFRSDFWHAPITLFLYLRAVRQFKPDIIIPYLPRQHLKTTLVRKLTNPARLVWGIRASEIDWAKYSKRSQFLFPIVTKLSRCADGFIANSQAGADFHTKIGYPKNKMYVVQNGFDPNKYRPSTEMRNRIRAELGIGDDVKLVGMLARFDPMKRNEDLLYLGSVLREMDSTVHLVSVGKHTLDQRNNFLRIAEDLGIMEHVTLIDETSEPEAYVNAFDLLVILSLAEGFPNVALEALACGTPVVSTDVGDMRLILGEDSRIITSGDWETAAEIVLDEMINHREESERIKVSEQVGLKYSSIEMAHKTIEVCRKIHSAKNSNLMKAHN